MKLIFIRHGDPDYSIDSLTPKGWKEAEYLSDRIARLDVKEFFVSPLGRAKDTASFTLKKMNRTATEYDWLQEFTPRIIKPNKDRPSIVWDWLPSDWTCKESFYDKNRWYDDPLMQTGNVKEEFHSVTSAFDVLLSRLGYDRDGNLYKVREANNDSYVFFCHFGITCVLVGYLLGISPMALWHGTCIAPTGVTTITTEERRKGIACFRINAYGDISHLYVNNEEPAFAARFCECYDNEDQRHD